MALNVLYTSLPNQSLGYSILRLRDSLYYDFNDGSFKAVPTTQVSPLTVGTGIYVGLYKDRIAATPVTQFSDGQYAITIHNIGSSNAAVGLLSAQMANGDDSGLQDKSGYSLLVPPPTAAQLDAQLSGAHGSGTWVGGGSGLTGAQIATAVWTDAAASDFSVSGSPGKAILANLDVNVGSRSTFAGGAVASVTAPVTAGTVTDKTGYALAIAPPTAAQVATAVWTDTTAGDLNVAGSPGKLVTSNLDANVGSRLATVGYIPPTIPPTAAQIAMAVLTDATASDLAVAGSIGNLISTNLDAKVSTRLPTNGYVLPPTAAAVATAVLTDTMAGDLSVTGSIGFLVTTNLDSRVSSRLSTTGYTVPPTVAQIDGQLSTTHGGGAWTGAGLTGAQVASAVWQDVASADFAVAGSIGKIVATNLDVNVGSRLGSAAYTSPIAPPTAAAVASAVWTDTTPGDFAVAGSPGKAISTNLDVNVGSRLPTAGYTAAPTVVQIDAQLASSHGAGTWVGTSAALTGPQIAAAVWQDVAAADFTLANSIGLQIRTNLDANVASRSTFNGGAVASVTTPVTVGTNNDKAGYGLRSDGLDAITIETGVNARQALSPILAASAGALEGAGSGTIVIKGGNVATTRILATTDGAGNRSSVILSLPN